MSPGPAIVDKDTDLNELIPSLVKGGFDHTGQVCVSVQPHSYRKP